MVIQTFISRGRSQDGYRGPRRVEHDGQADPGQRRYGFSVKGLEVRPCLGWRLSQPRVDSGSSGLLPSRLPLQGGRGLQRLVPGLGAALVCASHPSCLAPQCCVRMLPKGSSCGLGPKAVSDFPLPGPWAPWGCSA